MEHQDNVVCHSLVGDEDFLRPIDDEVPPLIVGALLCEFNNVIISQSFDLAKLRPDHDWNLPYQSPHAVIVLDHNFFRLLPSSHQPLVLRCFNFNVLHLDIYINFSGICQVSKPRLMGEDWLISLICFKDPRDIVHMHLLK
jgi:hypothetical protein